MVSAMNQKQTEQLLFHLSEAVSLMTSLQITVRVSKLLVDTLASSTRKITALDELNEKLKLAVKADLLEASETVRQGNVFEAVMSDVTKEVLNTIKVKEFLGRQLDKFMTSRTEHRLTFRPRS